MGSSGGNAPFLRTIPEIRPLVPLWHAACSSVDVSSPNIHCSCPAGAGMRKRSGDAEETSMTGKRLGWLALTLCMLTAATAHAQQTSGNVTGRVLDQAAGRRSWRGGHGHEQADRLQPRHRHGRRGRVSPDRAAGRHLRDQGRARRLPDAQRAKSWCRSAPTSTSTSTSAMQALTESVQVQARHAAHRDHDLRRSAASSTPSASSRCRSTAASSRTWRRRFRASASASTPTRPRARSTRRRSAAATAAT